MAQAQQTVVCGDCWYEVRPDQYQPWSRTFGTCSACGQNAMVNRVRADEIVDLAEGIKAAQAHMEAQARA